MPDELKPCPFCGSRQLHAFGKWVFCQDCGVEGPTTEPVIAAWNRRAESPESEQIAQLTRERDEAREESGRGLNATMGAIRQRDEARDQLKALPTPQAYSLLLDTVERLQAERESQWQTLIQQRDELAAALEKVKSTCDDEENNERGIGIDSPLIEYIFKGRKFAARNIRKCIVDPSAILAERDAKIKREVSEQVRELVLAAKYALMEIVASYRANKTNNDGSELHFALEPFEGVE